MALRRALHLESLRLLAGLSISQLLRGVLVPGCGFLVGGRRMLGWACVGTYALAAVVFVVALGYRSGSVAYGILIALHATSIVFLEGHWLRDARFRLRLTLAVATLLAVWLLMYSPLMHFVERNWVRPVRIHNQVVLIKPHSPGWTPQHGDWLMYDLERGANNWFHRDGGIYVREGFGWGPVLAKAGDRVAFSTNAITINGTKLPRRSIMPTSGELVVPEKHWFVWPEMDIRGAGNRLGADAIMVRLAIVSESQFVGTPFKRWLWRRQKLS